MDDKQSLKNADIKIAEIVQQLKLLDYKIHEIKTNDLKHLQQRIDSILDKISKSGYESLTKAEKDFLFQAGKDD